MAKKPENSFASRLIQAREAKGWTRYQLGKETGISLTLLGRYERGEQQPTLETARRLAVALGVTIDSLAGVPTTPGA